MTQVGACGRNLAPLLAIPVDTVREGQLVEDVDLDELVYVSQPSLRRGYRPRATIWFPSRRTPNELQTIACECLQFAYRHP